MPAATAQWRHRLIHADLLNASESSQLALAQLSQSDQALYFLIQAADGLYLPIAFVCYDEWGKTQDSEVSELRARQDVSVTGWWPRRFLGWRSDGLASKLVRLVGTLEKGRRPMALVLVHLPKEHLREYVGTLLRNARLHTSGVQVNWDRFTQFVQAQKFPLPTVTALGEMDIVAHHVNRTHSLEVEPIWPNWSTYRKPPQWGQLVDRLSVPSPIVRFPLDSLALTDKAYLLWDTSGQSNELVGYLTQDGVSHRLRFHFPRLDPLRARDYFDRLRLALGGKWTQIEYPVASIRSPSAVEPAVWSGIVRAAGMGPGQNLYWADGLGEYLPPQPDGPCADKVKEASAPDATASAPGRECDRVEEG